jgi:hypothetical protein
MHLFYLWHFSQCCQELGICIKWLVNNGFLKDLEGGSHGLAFAWRDWWKPRRTSVTILSFQTEIWIWEPSNMMQGSANHLAIMFGYYKQKWTQLIRLFGIIIPSCSYLQLFWKEERLVRYKIKLLVLNGLFMQLLNGSFSHKSNCQFWLGYILLLCQCWCSGL